MAFNINPEIPLQVRPVDFGRGLDLMQQAQINNANLEKHRLEMQRLREQYEAEKEARKQQKAMQAGIASELAGIQSGKPAQYAPLQYQQTPQTGQMPYGMTGVLANERGQNMPQPKAFGEDILAGNFNLNREMVAPAVEGRVPDIKDILNAQFKTAIAIKDIDSAFDAAKKLKELEKNTAKWGMNPTKGINEKGEPDYFVVNELGQKQFLGVNPYESPKEPKTSLVRTTLGFEVVPQGQLPKGKPVEQATQPRQPRLQQVTDTSGTYIVDIDTLETRPVLINGKSITKPELPAGKEESSSAGYALRMKESSKLIDELEKKGKPTLLTSVASNVPILGGYLERSTQTADQQKYKNAALAWIRAKLRDESGAVITDKEAESEYSTYFPVIGDSEEVVAQKAELRKISEQEMMLKAGKASKKVDESIKKKDREEYLFERAKAIKSGNKNLVDKLDAKAVELGIL